MVFKKTKKKRGNVEKLREWKLSRKEEPPEEDVENRIETRQTRLKTKLINPLSSSYQLKQDEEDTNTDMPKKKKHLSQRKYSGKTIVIDVDDDASNTPTYTKGQGTIVKNGDIIETLQLSFWDEDLCPMQLELSQKREQEYNELISRLENLTKQNGGEVVYKSDSCTAYQFTTNPPSLTTFSQPNGGVQVAVPHENASFSTPPALASLSQGNVVLQTKGGTGQNTYQLVMDPRLGLIVGTMTPTGLQGQGQGAGNQQTAGSPAVATVTPQIRTLPPVKKGRGRPPTTAVLPTPHPPPPTPPPPPLQALQQQFGVHSQPQPSTSGAGAGAAVRPAECTAVGGLATGTGLATKAPTAIVDLTSDDGRPAADSREVAFNKLQGKTFPSLVVVARPHLHAKEAGSVQDRAILDTKVKSVLVHTPTKFTEWLIQQGLVRSEQHCTHHTHNKLNLGMYSDVSKFPYSGGYVWISECCPHRFVSVFSGSLFEGSTHPPSVLLKLIYHWACQTNIQNVVQWVKVDNLYVKGLFTWLRACCTYALQQHLKPMGGPGKNIEVGVISLGTTSQDGSQRQVKVEVLGILDMELRLIRLRAVEPLADGDRNYKRRFSKILEPLRAWVHPESTICTDLTVDKGTLHYMGFANIIQNTSTGVAGNQQVMEYLRKIVPRMFQNTLSLLSRQIIQQFLDELVWREWYGQTSAQAFNNMIIHLAEQTRIPGESLISRLNKVAANPFKSHTYLYQSPQKVAQEQASNMKRYGRKRMAPFAPVIELDKPKSAKKLNINMSENVGDGDQVPQVQVPVPSEAMVPLESYYYGNMEGDPNSPLASKVTLNVRCCVCKVPYTNNIALLDHLLAHAHNINEKSAVTQCRYCLASLPTVEDLNKHIGDLHPVETRSYGNNLPACVLCEQRFASNYMLGKHMSKEHVPQELPYQCGTCNFRCSSHRQAIDHFYTKHDGATTVQCPFCLKSTTVWSSGRVMSTNVTFFFAHLQKHQKKAMAKKCYKCALWFIQKETLKDHQQKGHLSFAGKRGVKPWVLPHNYVMVPKSKIYQSHMLVNATGAAAGAASIGAAAGAANMQLQMQPVSPPDPLHKLQLELPPDTQCKECHHTILTPEHYPQKLSCSSCRFVTDCSHSMQMHKAKCRRACVGGGGQQMPWLQLAAPLHCVCGYQSQCGNQVAKHLALCEQKTAYASIEVAAAAAAAATHTHSMLDVLGLVRRQEEDSDTPAQVNEPTTTITNITAIPTTTITIENKQQEEAVTSTTENDSPPQDDLETSEPLKCEPKVELNEMDVTTIE